MGNNLNTVLRSIPAVGVVVETLQARREELSPRLATFITRRALDRHRARLRKNPDGAVPTLADIVTEVDGEIGGWDHLEMRRVVNATGIILHSGLGRAVLPSVARDATTNARGYMLLEVDREAGDRRRRDSFCEDLLCELTGAEAALTVNNNAAATMIILNSLAKGKDVVVSRSQMIEIGGSFRLPDVFEASGCRLKEVGTTNKSYGRDYESVIDAETGALMVVHTSNYKLVGFTEHVEIEEMVPIGRRHGVPVIHDLGSGSILDLRPFGVMEEPPVSSSVKANADVICFSGDKMIGGPQAGIIIGRKEWIDRIRKNPLARAFRIDKTACLALEATLKLYFEPERILERIPALRMLTVDAADVADDAKRIAKALHDELGDRAAVDTFESTSEMGAGSIPTRGIPTTCVAVHFRDLEAGVAAYRLRMRELPIFSRVQDGRVLFDPRTLRTDHDGETSDECELVRGVAAVARHAEENKR